MASCARKKGVAGSRSCGVGARYGAIDRTSQYHQGRAPAILSDALFEYAAGEEGEKILWEVEPFKSSIYAPGSKTEELVRGKKTSVGDWEHIAKQPGYMQKIGAAYGFPREEKK